MAGGTRAASRLLLAAVLLGACGDDLTGVERISPAEAKTAMDKGAAVFVDVRDVGPYAQQHIKGALSIPLNELPRRLGELPRNKKIITYCA